MNPASLYIYELRRGEEIIVTGQITHEGPVEIGERIMIAGRDGIVRSITPIPGQNQKRLVVQLLPSLDDP
jgi:antitoxin (DNA-binding transcriptional repressor) of toxin-antitoxin stability system